MGKVSGMIDVHFTDFHEIQDKIYTVVRYVVPMKRGKWVVRRFVEKTHEGFRPSPTGKVGGFRPYRTGKVGGK
ncbi:MAG: hypothetical protein QW815_00390 [Nitrososphaerota archaeon]